MNLKSSLKKNAAYNMVFQVVQVITPLITAPYLSRTLGPSGVGTYSYAQTLVDYFFLFSMLGINDYGNRSIAQVKSNKKVLSKTFWQIYYMQMIQAILVTIAYFVFCFTAIQTTQRLLHLLYGITVLSAFVDINWLAYGLEQFRMTTLRNMMVKFSSLILILVFVKKPTDIWIYALITTISTILGKFIICPIVFRELFFFPPDGKEILKHFKPNLILFIPSMAISIFYYTDKVMLGFMRPSSELGFYTYAVYIVQVSLAFVTAICTAFMPRISHLISTNEKKTASVLFDKAIHYTMIILIAISFGLAAISEKIIPMYLGKEYIQTAKLLNILIFSIPVSGCATVIRMLYLIPREKDITYTLSVVVGAVVNIVGNFFWISHLGAAGASVMTVLANSAMLLIQILSTHKAIPYFKWVKRLSIYIIIGMIMWITVGLISNYLGQSFLGIIISILVGGFLYVVLSSLSLVIIEKDKWIINNIKRMKIFG